MKTSTVHLGARIALLVSVLFPPVLLSQTARSDVVLQARIVNGRTVYKLNGKTVEDRRDNSLLNNLTAIVKRGNGTTQVLIIIDVKASFEQIGKLETALDKVGFQGSRKFFVCNCDTNTMNEIHWDQSPLSVPFPDSH